MQQKLSIPFNNNDTVSIALAVYNGEKYLPKLLESLNNQTIKPFELVVLDDCSSDNSLDVIKNYPLSFPKRIFSNTKNSGPVFTFKKLTELCSGNFISFCDQDDIWLPEKVEKSLVEIKKIDAGTPGLVFTDLRVVDEQANLLHSSFWAIRSIYPGLFSFTDILYGNIVTGCTIMINTAMSAELQKMPLNVIMHDWWMALIGFSFGEHRFVNEPTILYRSHGQSVTDKTKTNFIQVFKQECKHNSNFLKENILQAAEFKKIYTLRLNKAMNRRLDGFLSLTGKGFFYKIFRRNLRSLQRRVKRSILSKH